MNRQELILAAYEEVASMKVSLLQLRGLTLRIGESSVAVEVLEVRREVEALSDKLQKMYDEASTNDEVQSDRDEHNG